MASQEMWQRWLLAILLGAAATVFGLSVYQAVGQIFLQVASVLSP